MNWILNYTTLYQVLNVCFLSGPEMHLKEIVNYHNLYTSISKDRLSFQKHFNSDNVMP